VQQVRERLTWRDAFGVAIVLARKKSTHGITTPQRDLDLIRQRLAVAERDIRERRSGR
jgi:phage-related protein